MTTFSPPDDIFFDGFSDGSEAQLPVRDEDNPFADAPGWGGFWEGAGFGSSEIPPPDRDELLTCLNPAQRAAVLHGEGPILVLAGAGSGKTRVITHRAAYLVLRRGVMPWNILAVTFTNKAAGEMRSRLSSLMGPAASSCQVSTFHALGASLLRREAEKVGLTRSFVIYDDGDSLQLISRVLKEMELDDAIKPKMVRQRLDQAKNAGMRPDDIPQTGGFDQLGRHFADIYRRYEDLLRQMNAIDFGGLLLELVGLLKRDADVLEHYRQRFRWVMVDEFQDTNPIQYELIRLICPPGRDNLCAVGDDDQSIYRWRGADPANILSFERHFPGAQVVKLEQNYRSDGVILDAAYAVISKNRRRAKKRLWTERPQGEPLRLILAQDERGEASQVAEAIREAALAGVSFSDMAVFYRVNAQSRVLEEYLRLNAIPYRVIHGRAFYEREEIKDAASYLRLAINPRSDADFLRVINKPARGIGKTTLEKLQAAAQDRGLPLFEALLALDTLEWISAAARKRLSGFLDLVQRLSVEVSLAKNARSAVESALDISGLVRALMLENSDEAAERIDNLNEFVGAAGEFDRVRAEAESAREAVQAAAQKSPPKVRGQLEGAEPWGSQMGDEVWLSLNLSPLEAFLEQVSLLGDADGDTAQGKVSLMTLHAAKGLEFSHVFITGMEEGIFPHVRALDWDGFSSRDDSEDLAEERRLCYVGITRAMHRLTFSLARTRTIFGSFHMNDPSRFLRDIPPEFFDFSARSTPVRAAPPKIRHAHGWNSPVREEEVQAGAHFVPDPEALAACEVSDEFQAGRRVSQAKSRASSGRQVELDPGANAFSDMDFDQRTEADRRECRKGRGERPSGAGEGSTHRQNPTFSPGDEVFHGSFGSGVVISKAPVSSPNGVVTVLFRGLGEKRILARFLKNSKDC